MKPITALKPDEIIVIGTNAEGFHGAGAAGYAMRGTSRPNWSDDPIFLRAMRSPVGHPDRIGKWAVYGIARGFQQGREGASYGIETIRRPGLRRSVPLDEILSQIVTLFKFAVAHPEKKFLMTPIGCGMAGYSEKEMAAVFQKACQAHPPTNVIIPPDIL